MRVSGPALSCPANYSQRRASAIQHAPRGDELDMLNAAGAEGWELVGITSNNVAYLKREIEELEDEPDIAVGERATTNDVNANGAPAHQVAVKYRDPVTKETWSGRGRMATWLKRKQEAGE